MNILNNPTEIAGCILWLDGADKASMRQNHNDVGANVSNGNQVGYWGDKSGNIPSTNFTNWQTAKRPTYVESASALQFASVFSTSLSALGNLYSLNPTTIFIVTAPHAYTVNARIFTSATAGVSDNVGTANSNMPCYVSSAGVAASFVTNAAVAGVSFTALSSYNLFVHRNTQATNGLLNFINGNPSGTSSYLTQVTRTCYKIGCGILNGTTGTDDTSFYSGYIAEIIIYNSSLDSVNYTRVSNYLNNKWNPVQYIPKQIFALKPGNWSDTGLWSTSAYSAPFNQPLSGDCVYTNGFSVTANSSTKVDTLRNFALTPNINGGGSFMLSDGVSLSASILLENHPNLLLTLHPNATASFVGNINGSTNSTTRTVDVSAGSSLSIFGNVLNGNTINANNVGATIANAGTVNIFGYVNSVNGSQGNNVNAVMVKTTGILNIVGGLTGTNFGNLVNTGAIIQTGVTSVTNITGDIFSTYQSYGCGTFSLYNGTLNVLGNVSGPPSSFINQNGVICLNNTTGSRSVNITGNVRNLGIISNANLPSNPTTFINVKGDVISDGPGSAINHYASTGGTCFIRVTGSVFGSNLSIGIGSSITTYLSVFGNLIHAPNGFQAAYVPRCQVFPTLSAQYTRHAVNGYDKFVYYYTGNTVFVPPLSTNVLQGVTYNFGTLTGAMVVPAITAVNAGVKVGNQIGSAYLSVSDFWNEPLSAIQINSNTIGEYMKKTLTVNSLSSVLNSLDFSKL